MVVTTGGWLVASSGERPGMLLNILQYTGYPPAAKNCPQQNVNSAEFEKPCSMVRTTNVEFTNELINDIREAIV